ncbi:MAG: hypothetical protein CMH65_00540 [Nevskiales bacterium]|nr:hypothetical protein [Nevskiales bacterium]
MSDSSAKRAIQEGVDALSSGNYSAALRHFDNVLLRSPADVNALRGKGVALAMRGDALAGVQFLEEARSLNPNSAGVMFDLARVYEMAHRLHDSADSLNQLYAIDSDYPGCASALIRVFLAVGKRRDALRVLRREYNFKRITLSLMETYSGLLRDVGDIEGAKSAWKAILMHGPARDVTYVAYAKFLSESNLESEARKVIETGLHYHGESPSLQCSLAQLCEFSGEFSAAAKLYRRALQVDSGNALALAGLLGLGEAGEYLQRARNVYQNSHSRSAKARIAYALGKVSERRADYEDAFSWWMAANEHRRREAGEFNRAAMESRADRLLGGCDFDLLAKIRREGVDSRIPILVVGMPRSGTTLVEQVLAAHSCCIGAGELQDLPIACANILEGRDGVVDESNWCEALSEKPVDERIQAGMGYIRELERRLVPGARHVVDKAPFNFFNVGVASALVPRARIIWCLRDPRDVCLSIFAENFSASQAYATSLDDIAWLYVLHLKLLAHWQSALGTQIFAINYAGLVSNPEEVTGQLLDYLGLEHEEACFRHHETVTGSKTPSRMQVRKPINKSAIGRWRRYEQHLSGLLNALDRYDPGGRLRGQFVVG